MAISSEVIRSDHLGDGSNNTFQFEFIIYSQDDLDVYVDGTIQTVDIEFTVATTDIEVDAGGNIVFGIDHIPADGAKVAILSGAPYTQLTVLSSRDETYEETYDKAVILIKQLREVISRAILFAVSSTTDSITLPEPEAAKHLKWAADLLSLENVFVPTFPDPVEGYLLKWAPDLISLENVRPEPIVEYTFGINMADVDVTISSGVITVSDGSAHYIVDTESRPLETEGGVSLETEGGEVIEIEGVISSDTDDLEKILGLTAGDLFTLSPKDSARTIVIKNGAFFQTAGGMDCLLTDVKYETLFRMLSGGVARELSRSANG